MKRFFIAILALLMFTVLPAEVTHAMDYSKNGIVDYTVATIDDYDTVGTGSLVVFDWVNGIVYQVITPDRMSMLNLYTSINEICNTVYDLKCYISMVFTNDKLVDILEYEDMIAKQYKY